MIDSTDVLHFNTIVDVYPTKTLNISRNGMILYGLDISSLGRNQKFSIIDNSSHYEKIVLFVSNSSFSWRFNHGIAFKNGFSIEINNNDRQPVSSYITVYGLDNYKAYSAQFTEQLEEELSKD